MIFMENAYLCTHYDEKERKTLECELREGVDGELHDLLFVHGGDAPAAAVSERDV